MPRPHGRRNPVAGTPSRRGAGLLAGWWAGPHLLCCPSPGRTPLADPVAHLTTALARRYAIERELGRGGMSTVYLALDRRHGRPVALKVLAPELAAAIGPDRFLREIGIVARLGHPNILPLHDSGRAGGLLYSVFPYIEGGSLRDRLQRGPPLPVPEAVAIAREVADALAHAHAHGVIHRDVKPDNILLHEGHALLADFGVARAADDGTPTDSGLAVGTAAYASPEQAAGSRSVDERSDVYALGCVLYEMLVGAPGGRELLERRFTEPLPRLSPVRPDVPPWIDGVLGRALAAHPGERLPSARAFRDALATPGDADAAGAAPRGSAPAAGRSRWMAAGAAALAVIAAALAFVPGRLHRAEPRRLVVAGFENRTGDTSLAVLGDIATDYIARGLATTRLLQDVYDARATAREAGQPVRMGVAAGRELARRIGAGSVLAGSFYREGDSLHFEAQLVDAATGRLVLALQPVVGSVRERTRLVELLRQRVMAGFAVIFQPAFGDWQPAGVPPTYAAYREMLAATDDLWLFKQDEGITHLRRAIAEDSTYAWAKAQLANALAGQGACREVDSLAQSLSGNADQLTPGIQGLLGFARATCLNDRSAKLDAAKAVLQAVPQSIGFTVLAGIEAIELARPREALEILGRLDAVHLPLSPQQRNVYWSFVGYAHHDLGEFDEELAAARRMGEGSDGESARALAGRGDADAVARVADRWVQQPEGPGLERAECAALELRAHGARGAAQALLDRVVAARGDSGAAVGGEEPCLWNLFSAHYYAGRLQAAQSAYLRKAAGDTADVQAHAALAAIAARLGDGTQIEAQRRWLAARTNPPATLGLARVAALQGRRAEAVLLLRQAISHGVERHFIHVDPDFESLRDDPSFRELMRPQG